MPLDGVFPAAWRAVSLGSGAVRGERLGICWRTSLRFVSSGAPKVYERDLARIVLAFHREVAAARRRHDGSRSARRSAPKSRGSLVVFAREHVCPLFADDFPSVHPTFASRGATS